MLEIIVRFGDTGFPFATPKVSYKRTTCCTCGDLRLARLVPPDRPPDTIWWWKRRRLRCRRRPRRLCFDRGNRSFDRGNRHGLQLSQRYERRVLACLLIRMASCITVHPDVPASLPLLPPTPIPKQSQHTTTFRPPGFEEEYGGPSPRTPTFIARDVV